MDAQPPTDATEQTTTELANLVDQLGAVIDGLYALAFELRTITRDSELAAANGARLEIIATERHPANGHRYCAACNRYL